MRFQIFWGKYPSESGAFLDLSNPKLEDPWATIKNGGWDEIKLPKQLINRSECDYLNMAVDSLNSHSTRAKGEGPTRNITTYSRRSVQGNHVSADPVRLLDIERQFPRVLMQCRRFPCASVCGIRRFLTDKIKAPASSDQGRKLNSDKHQPGFHMSNGNVP
jgi:hypothetical protein